MSRSSIKIMPGAVVCSECELKGDITIGSRTVIHPKVRIIAESAPIIIGESNLIEEQVQIINRGNDGVMIIGNNNVFEVGSECYSIHVGDHNVFEAKSIVSHDTEVSSGCIIGAMCRVSNKKLLTENTVIYGSECRMRVAGERPLPQTLQLDFLTKILPNYHHIKKASKSASQQKAQ